MNIIRVFSFLNKSLAFCGVFLSQNLALNAQEPVSDEGFKIDLKTLSAQEELNVAKANEFINSLYVSTTESSFNASTKKDDYLEVGTQAGYRSRTDANLDCHPLIIYRRVWAYDAGLALSLAVENGDPTADARARWLLKHGTFIKNPENPDSTIFAGWPFSSNQRHLGDNWADCRFMTGANAYALVGLAKYITSEFFNELSKREQATYLKFYANALEGILYQIESAGPNEGLVTAGWTVNILEESSQTIYSYERLLDILGYGLPETIDNYPNPVQRIRTKNVFIEHCSGILALLNYNLKHYNQLLGADAPYSHSELNNMRTKLRHSIFEKLYHEEEQHFITGRTAYGKPNNCTAIDNTTWLILSLELEELTADQLRALSESLAYTVKNFTKEFFINGRSYFAAHYFEDGFEDPYIEKSFSHSESLQIEATCGLICSLLKLVRKYPENPHVVMFRETTLKLWQSMQYLINDFGFIYSSGSLKNVSEPMEASVSAIWYLRAYNYFNKKSKF